MRAIRENNITAAKDHGKNFPGVNMIAYWVLSPSLQLNGCHSKNTYFSELKHYAFSSLFISHLPREFQLGKLTTGLLWSFFN